jgi:hypothetical protein
MSEAAATLAYAIARGVPHYVQLVAAAAFDNPGGTDGQTVIDEGSVRRGVVDLLLRQHGELTMRFADLAASDQKIVRALAQAPVREITSRAFAERTGVSTSTARFSVKRLEEHEHVLLDERLGYRLADPIFERWIRHAAQLESGVAPDPDKIDAD